MTDSPWLSIVMPVHNSGQWLADAMQSLVEQEDSGFECIVIDSSETLATQKIVEGFVDRLDIKMHRRPDLAHWRSKTNFGVEAARAEHVCTLHHDDLWVAGRTRKIREWLKVAPEAAMHFHPSVIIDERGKSLGLLRCPLPADVGAAPRDMLLTRLLVQNYISLPALVWRRDAYLAVGGLDTDLWYTGDWDLYFKLALAGPCHYHADPLTLYRIHGQSLTISGSQSAEDFRRQMNIVLDRYADRIAPEERENALRAARASIEINVALADTKNGKTGGLLPAFGGLMRLGPAGISRYFRDSRLVERVVPRLRASLAGRL